LVFDVFSAAGVLIPFIPLMKDFVLQVGNLGGGKTVEGVGMVLYYAEQTSLTLAELQRKVDAGEIKQSEMDEERKHQRECYLNFPLKMALLKADSERWARSEEALGNKYRAMAYRDMPNHIHFIGNLNEVPKDPDFAGVDSVSPSIYHFIARRRNEVEANPLPDRDEGRDLLLLDEAQDLARSRRSGDRYVKIISENADFFRKMGLEVQYQGPQQSQMDKNFRGKSTKKTLAEKFEYTDPKTGLPVDPENNQHYYFLKFTVFDTSNTERRPSATFFMPYEDKDHPQLGEFPGAKLCHRYYGTNVFHSQSLTTRGTLSEFTGTGGGAAPPTTDIDMDEDVAMGEPGGTANDLLIAVAQNMTSISKALKRNPFFNLKPKDAKALLKWLSKRASETT